MSIDWDAFKAELSEKDKKTLEKMGQESDSGDFEEVPDGDYEVRVSRLELGTSKSSGNPTAYVNFDIIAGDYEGDVIYHTFSLGGNKAGFKLKKFVDFVMTLKSGVDFSYDNFKDENGEFDGYLLEKAIEDVFEAIGDNTEYAIEKSTNKGGYREIKVTQVFDSD